MLRPPFSAAALLASVLQLFGCERHISVGALEQVGQGGATGEKSDWPSMLVFESHFEGGDLSEWGEPGSILTSEAGEISVQGTTVNEGAGAALVLTHETGGHVVLSVEGAWTEILFGFFLHVSAQYETSNWPILHIDARTDGNIEQLWDVGLDGSGGDGYQVFLWEMPAVSGEDEGTLAALTSGSFPAGKWTHFQVHLRAAPDESGFIRFYLDETLVLDLSGRPAGNGDPLHLGLGSFAFNLEPRPAELFIDDVTVHVP